MRASPLPDPPPQGGREDSRRTAGEGASDARARAAGEREARLAAVDWDEVRRAYELSNETVVSIQKRFELTRHELRARRIDEAWTARPPVAAPALLPRRKPVGSAALELKLNKLLVAGIAMLTKRLAEDGLTDENARTLTELCRAQEIRMRSTRNEKAAKAREKKNNDAGHDYRDDPAWLDAELARRLDRLGRGSGAGGDPRGDVAGGEAGVSRGVGGMGAA